ncbi:MAG: fibronectin type III domain-containing protein [Actinomycetia bacterium]|nr:fibronectin type III domain-containing protein [Actinomycetes bacterium]
MNQGTIGHRLIAPGRLVLAAVAAALAALWLVPAALATPDEPAGLKADPINNGVVLSWTDPGDSAITGYQYRYRVNMDPVAWVAVDPLPTTDVANGLSVADATAGWRDVVGDHAGTTTVTVSGLDNGVEYVIELRAHYADGTDADGPGTPASAAPGTGPADPGPAASVTGTAGKPLSNFRAEPGDAMVTLRWDNPGDSTITGYEYRTRTRPDTGGEFPAWAGADTPDDLTDDGWVDLTGAQSASSTSGTVTTTNGTDPLLNGTEYQIEIRAKTTTQGRESTLKFVAGKKLTGFTATAAGNRVTLSWNHPTLALAPLSSYQYRYSTNGGATWTAWLGGATTGINPGTTANTDAVAGATTPKFVVTGLTVGATYTFQVKIRGQGDDYGASDMATVTIGGSLESFTVAPGDASVVLSWTRQNDPGVTGYQYRFRERSNAGGNDNGWAPWPTGGGWITMPGSSRYQSSWRTAGTGADSTIPNVTPEQSLVNGVEYQFQVQTTGGKTYISEAKAAVVGIPLAGLVATPGSEQVTLSWTLPTYPPGNTQEPVTGYEVRYSPDGGKTWTAATGAAIAADRGDGDLLGAGWRTSVTGATASAVVTGLTNGRTYTFQIRALGEATGTAANAFRYSGFGASNMAPVTVGVVSSVPVITGVAPVGPANNNMPVVSGVSAGDRSTVSVFTSATCDGTAVATGTADRDGNFSVTVQVADDSSTMFYATSTPRLGGNMSACSPAGMTYVEDSTGPTAMIHGDPAEGSTTASGDAQFLLTSSEAGATFEYSLDGVAFHSTGQVVELTDLGHGMHTLTVRATDSAGNVGAEFSRSWEVERANPRGCTYWGTEGDDQIQGTAGDDVICGLGGNDVIHGGGGNDVIYGDAGGDVIHGGSGDDRIYAGSGNDRVNGNAGDDMIRGGGGVDTIRGGKGDDTIYGNAGDDTIYGDKGSDMIHGGPGNDTAMVGSGDRARSIENRL